MVAAGVGAGAGASTRRWPQPAQNTLPGGLLRPHLGQAISSLLPHCVQNEASFGFPWPQDGQSTVLPLVYASQSKAIVRESSGVVNVASCPGQP